jgi:Cys-rich protein (TIGR01571 family)
MADAPEVVPDSFHPPDEKKELEKESPVSPFPPEKQKQEFQKEDYPGPADNEESSPKHIISNEDVIRKNDTANEATSPKLVVSQLDDATGLQVIGRKSNEGPEAIEGSNTAGGPEKVLEGRTANVNPNRHTAEESEWQAGFWDFKSSGDLCIFPFSSQPNRRITNVQLSDVESITCPCILAGRTNTRLHDPEATHLPSTNLYCAGCCILSLTTIGALPLFCFMTTATRREVRYRYNIKGDNFSDCWKATFFPCCALVQEEKEVLYQMGKAREDQGYGKRDDKMEYKT